MFHGSVTTLADLIQMLLNCRPKMIVEKDDRNVITRVTGDEFSYQHFRNVKKAAAGVLFTARGERRPAREEKLLKDFGYEVVCIESNGEEWLALGIKTPVGIIPYEL